MNKKLFLYIHIIIGICLVQSIYAKKNSFNYQRKSTPKPAYDGFGKTSKVNGRIKTKATRGYFKPSNNYKFVNPYARSR